MSALRQGFQHRQRPVLARTETDCPLGTDHSPGFNTADLADVRQRVITAHTGLWRPAALFHGGDTLMSHRQKMYSAFVVA